jgi:hypothetical protein
VSIEGKIAGQRLAVNVVVTVQTGTAATIPSTEIVMASAE